LNFAQAADHRTIGSLSPIRHSRSIEQRGTMIAMRQRLPTSALILGAPMLIWQLAFFLGAAVILLFMTFWHVKNYQLAVDFSFENWLAFLGSPIFYSIYVRTVGYSLIAALSASVVVFPCAYGLAFKTSARVQRISLMLLITPYFTSYLVRSYSWRFMFEHDGIINSALRGVGLPIYEFQGSFLSLLIGYYGYFLPLVALIQLLGLMNIDKHYLEAANNLGAARFRTVFTVVIPLARGALLVGFAFAFMMAMGDYVVPAFVGGGAQPTLSILIVNSIQGQSNFPKAAVISATMLSTLVAVFFSISRLVFLSEGDRA
jgi:spermidine/putrescine transport system permease protein